MKIQFNQTDRESRKGGGGFTVIEILFVIAIIAILASLTVPTCNMGGHTRAKVSRVKSDMRSMTVALETYRVDHRAYPAAIPIQNMGSQQNALVAARGAGHTTSQWGVSPDGLAGLTAPVAYLTSPPRDPFSPGAEYPIAYATGGGMYILLSPGPDQAYDIDPSRDIAWEDSREEIIASIIGLAYDPTNGTTSSGDVFRFSEPQNAQNCCCDESETETPVEKEIQAETTTGEK